MAGVISGGRTGPLDGLTEQHRSSRANQQDAFSRPLGCFAIPALRSRLYQNLNSDYDRLVVRSIKVPLAAGMVSIDVVITPAVEWTPELETPMVKIKAKVTVDDVQSWAFAGGSTSAVIVKFICVHNVCDGDAASVKKHQDIRKAFLDADTDQSNPYHYSKGGIKLLNFEAAAEVIEVHECYSELTLALTPGSQQFGHVGKIEAEDVNRQDAEEKCRAKIDPKNCGSDGLGGEDGWGSVFFVFSIFESDATPSLYVVGNDSGSRDPNSPEEVEAMERMPTSTDELLILELSA